MEAWFKSLCGSSLRARARGRVDVYASETRLGTYARAGRVGEGLYGTADVYALETPGAPLPGRIIVKEFKSEQGLESDTAGLHLVMAHCREYAVGACEHQIDGRRVIVMEEAITFSDAMVDMFVQTLRVTTEADRRNAYNSWLMEWFESIMQGISCLLQHNIVHVDMHVDNVALLQAGDGSFEAGFIDFGSFARLNEDSERIRSNSVTMMCQHFVRTAWVMFVSCMAEDPERREKRTIELLSNPTGMPQMWGGPCLDALAEMSESLNRHEGVDLFKDLQRIVRRHESQHDMDVTLG